MRSHLGGGSHRGNRSLSAPRRKLAVVEAPHLSTSATALSSTRIPRQASEAFLWKSSGAREDERGGELRLPRPPRPRPRPQVQAASERAPGKVALSSPLRSRRCTPHLRREWRYPGYRGYRGPGDAKGKAAKPCKALPDSLLVLPGAAGARTCAASNALKRKAESGVGRRRLIRLCS